MARLIPTDPLELAWFASPGGGTAAFTVDNSTPGLSSPTVELWELLTSGDELSFLAEIRYDIKYLP